MTLVADRSTLPAHASVPTRRAICRWLGACVLACRGKGSAQRAPAPIGSGVTPTRERRVFFEKFVAKRVGHSRESKESFELPLRSQQPFALLLDYAVDEQGAVIVQVNGKEVVSAPSFPASGHYDDTRQIEIPLTLSRFETTEIFTRIVGVGWGFAKIQVVGYAADAD